MCIAILKTKKGKITDEELKESFNSNRDGAGIAYTKNNHLYIIKGLFKVEDFIKAVRRAENECDNNMLIHCRIGTSGKKDKDNTHPFLVNKNVALIHNGILSIDVPKDSPKNDTQLFIEKYMKDIGTKDLLHSKTLHNLLATAIGNNNKFVMMDNTGYYKIINEKQGHWKDNVWFSNNSYKPVTRVWGYYGYDYDDVDWENKWYNNGYSACSQGKLFEPQPTDRVEHKTPIDFNFSSYRTPKDFGLSNADCYYIEDEISNITFERFAALDLYPVLDLETKKLITYEEAILLPDENSFAFLEDVSQDLYEYYVDCFDSVQEALYEDTEVA